jgi:hypothetical protein
MRDRTFVAQMMMLAVGLALLWTWALQAADFNDRPQRAGVVLDRARSAAAAEPMRSTMRVRNAPNSTTSSLLIEPTPVAEPPARASVRERISPSKS